MSEVDWGPAVVVLAIGLVLGTILVARFGARARAAAAPTALARRDLEGKRDALVLQLRELEDTAAKRTPVQLAHERYALELEAARAWKELDRLGARATAPAAAAAAARKGATAEPPAAAGAGRPAAHGFLWGFATAAAVAVLGLYLTRVIKPRDAGDSVTGNLPSVGQKAAPSDPDEQQLRQVLAQNPDDFDARVDLAELYFGRQDLMAVFNETQYVLDRSPNHPRALSYQALVRLAMGQGETAIRMLKQAQASGPTLIEPYLHLALVYARLGQLKDAEATMTDAQRRFPQQAEHLKGLMAQIRAAAEAPPAGKGSAPAQAAAAARAGGIGEGAAGSGAERGVSGVIDLDPALAGQVPAGALVFLTARAAGVSAGPPAAAKRLPAAFPLRFSLSGADSMMGEGLPDKLRLEARVDGDGDPLTRGPSDPTARLDGVAVGRSDLKLVLKR